VEKKKEAPMTMLLNLLGSHARYAKAKEKLLAESVMALEKQRNKRRIIFPSVISFIYSPHSN
jgi:hypothetical protein